MLTLWNEMTAAEATGGETQGMWFASRVEIDSRRVQLGDLFVAIKGDRVDGHHYVADALSRGAVAAVVSSIPEGVPSTASLLMVDNTMEALVKLARFSRARSQAKIVGITGSVGKTSSKEMIRMALAKHGKTFATTGNFNNHIGTPLNLANLPPDAAYGVFEMGMNHAGEIDYLTKMVRPNVAVITNVEAVHLEFFKDVGGIADAKAEIFAGVEKGGAAILNADNEWAEKLRDKARAAGIDTLFTFGSVPAADIRLVTYQPVDSGLKMEAVVGDKTYQMSVNATGKHWAMTALSALAVGKALGLPIEKTIRGMADFSEGEGRGKMQVLPVAGGEILLVDDSYNASPASMASSMARVAELHALKQLNGRKIAVLGDMLELGKEAPRLHAELEAPLLQYGFDAVFMAGALMRHLMEALPKSISKQHMMEAHALVPLIQKMLAPGDIVLVKGSHGSHMHEVAAKLSGRASK